MIPIPISTQIFAILASIAAIFFVALFLPTILELKRPKDSGPRRILETDGKEIVGFSILLAVYFREDSRGLSSLLEDIEPQEFEMPRKSLFSIPLPDMEF